MLVWHNNDHPFLKGRGWNFSKRGNQNGKKRFFKLAQLIKYAAKDVSKEEAWWKVENVAVMLGFERTDKEPDVLEVTDDSGYRSIIIGDTRGNVSLDTNERSDSIHHKGYVYLYSENCSGWKNDKRIWKYRCFPPIREIADMLEKLYNREYRPDIFCYYSGDNEEMNDCVNYIAEVVQKYIHKIASDKRTALEIFESCK